jgi:elongator complex protein 3
LHVYNHVLPVGQNHKYSNQHKGIGKQLLKYAEYIAWFHGKNGVAVISGEGVRNYYRKQGYKCEDSYEIKKFTNIYHHMYIFMSWLFCLVHLYYNFKL